MATSNEIPLNCLEKAILAWDREGLPFNSHFIVDFESELDPIRVREASLRLLKEIPLFHSLLAETPRGVSRIVVDQDKLALESNVMIAKSFDEATEREFMQKRFRLSEQPPLRIFYSPHKVGGSRLIMTVHHTAADGLAQALLMNEFFRAYEGQSLSAWATKLHSLRLRDYMLRELGPVRTLKLFSYFVLRILVPKKPKPATLLENLSHPSREVAYELIDLTADQARRLNHKAASYGMNPREFIVCALIRALDRVIESKGDRALPIVIAAPLSFRLISGKLQYFQNLSGLARVIFNRDEVQAQNFQSIFKNKFRKHHSLREAFRSVFASGLASLFLSVKSMRAQFQKIDENPDHVYSTVLVSAGRIPKSLEPPAHLNVKRIWGAGALFKNPGLSLTLTGTRSSQTIVIQYLNALISLQSVILLKNELLKELTQD